MASQLAVPGPAKLEAVTKLMSKLDADLETQTLAVNELVAYLEQLKLLGRDPRSADPIFAPNGIKTLARYAFESPQRATARGALKVLANSMLLVPNTRREFLTLGHEGAIISNLARHAEHMRENPSGPVIPMEDMAVNETLRLLFNVTHFAPLRKPLFTPAIPLIVTLLWKQDINPSKPLDPPFSSLINALLNLDFEDPEVQSSLCPQSPEASDQPSRVAARLVTLLDLSLKPGIYAEGELDQLLSPLVGVLAYVEAAATEEVKQYLRATLLPTEKDREEVLGKGTSLGSRVLKLSNNPMTPKLGDVASHLLYSLSDKDASKFVANVGFGYASGFLAKNNIPTPGNMAETSDELAARPFNPVTGQFLDSERVVELPEMTEDEKLREAERLYDLFERLKRTGIIDVQNPVEEAIRSGRFQEMDENRVTEVDSD
ncbi:Synembryn-like protein C3E7.04c like [Verticillium longisporum]|uniref:Synembryn-like protein C3E7.04c like n=1 Tax=Verticillium longisporum TaxID=100787 RepID=A0A8I2ZKV7_VERLO|nr:Synembryn-like protein C3E7.04c like [Verticillium longisporum]